VTARDAAASAAEDGGASLPVLIQSLLMRKLAVLLLFLALSVSGATKKPPAKSAPKTPPATICPETIPHPVALFLGTLSKEGTRQVTFKAAAIGTRFFFEEPKGVGVYRFVDGSYIREDFLRGTTLPKVMKRYAKK
jgi:hypothetical protein